MFLASIWSSRARLFDKNCLQVQYVASCHGYHIYICIFVQFFLRDRRSFTSRKLNVCTRTFLCFLHQFDRDYVYLAGCLGLFLLCSFLHHMIGMELLILRASLLTVLRFDICRPLKDTSRRSCYGSCRRSISGQKELLLNLSTGVLSLSLAVFRAVPQLT